MKSVLYITKHNESEVQEDA